METIEIETSEARNACSPAGRDAPHAPAAAAPSALVRDALDALQQAMEHAVASAVEQDLNAAIGQAAGALENMRGGRRARVGLVSVADCGVPPAGVPAKARLAEDQAAAAPFVLFGRLQPRSEPPLLAALAALAAFGSRLACRFRGRLVPRWPSSFARFVRAARIRRRTCTSPAIVLAGMLLMSIFGFFVGLGSSRRAGHAAAAAYDADPRDMAGRQVLTVMVRPQQSLRELGMLYAGHFDERLFKEICAFNPELRDPYHIEPGQLIRMPLPQGTLKKVVDTEETWSARSGVFARVARWVRGD